MAQKADKPCAHQADVQVPHRVLPKAWKMGHLQPMPRGPRADPRKPCQWKGIETMEGHLMPDHVHMLVGIPPKIGVSSFMGCLKGKSALPMSGRQDSLKCRSGNRKFWAEGHCVSTVGMNEATIAKCIREQEQADIA